jgi:vacuolar-type H+-ATPase subunit H
LAAASGAAKNNSNGEPNVWMPEARAGRLHSVFQCSAIKGDLVEDTLKRLLEAEGRAETMVEEAKRERERLIDAALAEAREREARFEAGCDDLRAPFLHEAEERAEQAVAELARKYADRRRGLHELAARHRQEAVAAALALLLDPER